VRRPEVQAGQQCGSEIPAMDDIKGPLSGFNGRLSSAEQKMILEGARQSVLLIGVSYRSKVGTAVFYLDHHGLRPVPSFPWLILHGMLRRILPFPDPESWPHVPVNRSYYFLNPVRRGSRQTAIVCTKYTRLGQSILTRDSPIPTGKTV
jgi:hypothetical protein